MLESQVLSIACDPYTNSFIRDVLCLPVYALRDVSQIRDLEYSDPMVFFVDGTNASDAAFKQSIEAAVAVWPQTVVIALVDRAGLDKLEVAFSSNAHDVLKKPLDASELLIRVRRRMADLDTLRRVTEIKIGDVRIDPLERKLKKQENEVAISPMTLGVLLQLAEVPQGIVKRQELKTKVWKDETVADGSLDRQIFELRKHLKDIGSQVGVKSVYGEGYSLDMNPLRQSNHKIIAMASQV